MQRATIDRAGHRPYPPGMATMNALLLIVKAGTSTGCHFVSTIANMNSSTQRRPQHLHGDSPALGRIVMTGRYSSTDVINGTIELKLAVGEPLKWRLKGQRFEQEPAASPPKEVPIPPIPPLPGLR